MSQDEWLILVDEQDQQIGRMLRSEVYEKNLKNYRAVNAFIVNDNGELWIPRRTANKRTFPLCLDMSVGGHVEDGESYDETFRRETMEELNIDIRNVPYTLLGKLTPHGHGTNAFTNVYEIQSNETPNYNPDDFTEYMWIKPADLLEKIAHGEKCKDDLPILVKHFYIDHPERA